jgi:type IX secretion system PorP/SprF family membrane protein
MVLLIFLKAMSLCYKILVMKKILPQFVFAAIIITGITANAQDVGFSQYYDQPFQRNPALSGIFTGDVRVTGSFRNQWQSVTVPYRTYGLSGELKLPANFIESDNFTIGLQLLQDVAGTSQYKSLQVMPSINYSIPLSQENNSYLSLGFMGGIRQQSFNPALLVLNDQYLQSGNGTFTVLPSSRQVFETSENTYFDLSTGLSYNGAIQNADYFVGVGMFHLTSPEIGFFDDYKVQLHKKLAVNFGLTAPLGEENGITIYGDYFTQLTDKFKRTGIGTIQAGLLFNHNLFQLGDEQKAITFGSLYRMSDAIIPVVKLDLIKFSFGVSYDVNISKLTAASHSRGGLEITIGYKSSLNYRNSDMRQTNCPRFGKGVY